MDFSSSYANVNKLVDVSFNSILCRNVVLRSSTDVLRSDATMATTAAEDFNSYTLVSLCLCMSARCGPV